MRRCEYRGFIIDRDNLGRLYVYNTQSPYSEDSDRHYIYTGDTIKAAKEEIDYLIERYG